MFNSSRTTCGLDEGRARWADSCHEQRDGQQRGNQPPGDRSDRASPRVSVACGWGDGSAIASSISIRASALSCKRRVGSFLKHRRNKARTAAGVSAGSAVQSGSFVRTAATISLSVSPLNAALAREHFVDHAPERPDVGALVDRLAPSPAQGLMYAAVPRISPTPVIPAGLASVGELRHHG